MTLLSPETPLQWGHRSFALDGAGIVDGTVVRRNHELRQVLPAGAGEKLSLAELASWWADHATNPCVLYVVDSRKQEALVLPDPLGAALSWHYAGTGYDLVSSDNVSLARVTQALGGTVTRSIDFQLQRVLFINGGYQVTSHREFATLPTLQYWQLTPEHTVARRYTSLDDRFEAPYGDQLHILRDELISHVTALAHAPTEMRIAHLTGGFDSRLVFAAALAAGVEDRFVYFCSGPPGTKDRVVADGLTQVYGLRRSSGGGLTPVSLPTHLERILAPMIHSGGLTAVGSTGLEPQRDVMAVGGGYGGVMRTVYGSNTGDLPVDVDSTELLRRFAPHALDQSSFLLPAARSRLAEQLRATWQASAAEQVPQDFIGDRLYTDVRARYHVGQPTLLWSRAGARFEPLYSVSALAISQSLPLRTRSTNVVGFDLMEMLVPGLSAYPFDSDRFSADWLQMRRRPEPREFPTWKSPQFESCESSSAGEDPVHPALAAFTGGAPSKPPTQDERKQFVERANRLGAPYWQVATLQEARTALGISLERLDLSSIEDSINLGYVRDLVKVEPRKRRQIRDAHALLGVLAWLSMDHDPSGAVVDEYLERGISG